jgi:lysyl-tRNA synthetase class 2
LEARANLLADIRAFFAARQVLEVETPVLSRSGNCDPNIESVATDEAPRRYLRTSPEYAMKRLLAAGLGDIYELGRVFRAGERGSWHNPEFTLLEWYRSDLPYLQLASEVLDLIRHCGRGRFDSWPEHWISYRDLFLQGAGVDPWTCTESELADCAAERGLHAGPLDHAAWLDLLFARLLQPELPGECLTIVHDFPPEQAALARIRDDAPPVAERFEVFVGQAELANGYQELSDADEQQGRFQRELRMRRLRGAESPPIDDCLLEALRHGLPDCSGVALGVDRLLMAILKLERIDAVLAFGAERV